MSDLTAEEAAAVLAFADQIATGVVIAIDALSTRPGQCVRLTALRSMLADLDRETLDAVLLDMDDRRLIQLEPDPERVALTAEDRACAIPLGGEQMHLVRLVIR